MSENDPIQVPTPVQVRAKVDATRAMPNKPQGIDRVLAKSAGKEADRRLAALKTKYPGYDFQIREENGGVRALVIANFAGGSMTTPLLNQIEDVASGH